MSRFNKKNILKPQVGNIGQVGNVEDESLAQPATIGTGLLNSQSKAEGNKYYEKTVNIPYEYLYPSKKNEYSQNQIEKLAENIHMVGLLENFVLIRSDDEHYIISSGHRRWRAIKLLIDRGLWGDTVPAQIKSIQDLDLNISDEMKEDLLIISTNAERRNNTEYDTLMETRKYTAILAELRKNGYKEIFGTSIEGMPTRTLVAERFNMSDGSAAKFMKVDTKGSEKVFDEMQKGNLTVNMAAKLASETKDVQDQIIEDIRQEHQEVPITAEMIERSKANVKSEKCIVIAPRKWDEDTKEIRAALTGELSLTESDYKKYEKAINTLKKLLCK